MKRSFNYTERKRINRKDVSIHLVSDSDDGLEVEAVVNMNNYPFPTDSRVILEAYTSTATAFETRDLPNAFNRAYVHSVRFEEIEEATGVLFNLKVVDSSGSGLLLGLADQIPWVGETDEAAAVEGLLPVRWNGESQLAWDLEFDADGKPTLVMPRRLNQFKSEIQRDVMFRTAVLPEVLRRILEKSLIEDDDFDLDDDEGWFSDWLSWINDIAELRGFIDELKELDDVEHKRRWIGDVVRAFACTNRFVDRLERDLQQRGS